MTAPIPTSPISRWTRDAMREVRSLATIRREKSLVAPSDVDLAWVERALARVGFPELPTPDAFLTYHRRQTVELIWPGYGIRVWLAPRLGLARWPTRFAASSLRRKLRRKLREARDPATLVTT